MMLERVINPSGGAEELEIFNCLSSVRFLGDGFPSNAKISLPKIKTFNNAFANWKGEDYPTVEELIITAPLVTDISMMFYCNEKMNRIVLNLSEQCTNMKSTFHACNGVEIVLNFSTKNVTNFNNCFANAGKIKRIEGALDFTSATNVDGLLWNCYVLTDVEFKPNTLTLSLDIARSASLTAESIQSIIDGLATVETAQNLTLHSAVLSKLTDEQWSIAEEKNWIIS